MPNIDTVKLNNGLTIYFYMDNRRHSTFFQHITLFGGKTKDFLFDGKEYHMQDGIAHILEHYIVEENSYGNFLKVLGEKQMITNASTHYEMTRFYFEAVENIDFGIKTLLNGIYSPLFSEEKLEKIKKPILQEIRGKMGNKFYHSNRTTLNNCFSKIKVRSIGGTLEEVQNTTLDDLIVCFEAFYQPSNQFIVVAGNFDKEHVLKTIKDFYEKLEMKQRDVQLLELNEDIDIVNPRGIVLFPTGEEYTEITYKVNLDDFSIKDRLKLDFYLQYFFNMYFGLTSSLYKELIDNQIITTSLFCSDFRIDNYMLISIGSYTNKSLELEKGIRDAFLKLDSFNEEMFEIDKRDSILKIILRGESLGDTVFPFVTNIVDFNYPYPDEVSDIEDFSFDDFVTMIKRLDFNHSTVTIIQNKEA